MKSLISGNEPQKDNTIEQVDAKHDVTKTMKIILWISIILTATILVGLNPWNNVSLNYFLIAASILGGPVSGTVLLFRWIDEKAAKKQLCYPGIQRNQHS